MKQKQNSEVMLNYFNIPKCIEKLEANGVKTKEDINKLSDEKLQEFGIAEGLISMVRKLLSMSEQEYQEI